MVRTSLYILCRLDATTSLGYGEVMMDPRFIDDLAQRLRDAIPPGMERFRKDLEQNFRAVLQGAFAKLDMVTREEFDVQRAVLQRTREKLERLEKELEKLGTGQPPQ